MRRPVSVLIIAATVGSADANVEIGGMAGVHLFNRNSELGVADRPDAPSQRNSVLAGIRIGVFVLERLGVEAELGVIPTVARESEFTVVDLTYRAHVVVQLRTTARARGLNPFVLAGAGALTVVHSRNTNYANDPARNIGSDTDAVYYVGAGAKLRLGTQWGARADARVLAVPSSDNALPPDPDIKRTTVDFEAMLSLYADLEREEPPRSAPPPPPPIEDDPDRDQVRGAADQCPRDPEDHDAYLDDDGCPDPDNDVDGIPDGQDRCAAEAEDRDGWQDDDGCPERDNDRDGIVDNMDACPAEAEDRDGFEDSDGCIDRDNDGDGVADAADTCGGMAETTNGYRDEDGCPDAVPGRIARLTAQRPAINFRINTAELSPLSRRVLDTTVAVLVELPEVRLEIRAHTDGTDSGPLSQQRAEAVRAYLIQQGIDGSRLIAKGYGDTAPLESLAGLTGRKLTAARAKNRRIELKLPGMP